MNQKERIRKYNPYKTKNFLLARKIHKMMMSLDSGEIQDFLFSTSYEEYTRYVSDCIDLKLMPIKYREWIREQAKFNYKK